MTIGQDFMRYSCQMHLNGFGEEAQNKLKNSKVLIVGVGGLGCPASLYLASSGVGTLGLADDDVVSLNNLHRQILYKESDIGSSKNIIAKKYLTQQNSSVKVLLHPRINKDNALEIIDDYDVILDCSDNFDTRYLINDACVIKKKPLVYGAIFQFEGQVAVWNVKNSDGTYSANYRDLFSGVDDSNIPNCADGGVIPMIGGVIGSMQAMETVKLITEIGDVLKSKLFIFDVSSAYSYLIKLSKSSHVEIDRIDESLPKIISIKDLENMPKHRVKLIDVRSKEEHDSYNIGGENVPLDWLEKGKIKLENNKITVFYCRSGTRSSKAAKIALRNNPSAKVMSLSGGTDAYRRWLNHG